MAGTIEPAGAPVPRTERAHAVPQPGAHAARDLRLAELLATVSLAIDLAHDVPAESAPRDAFLAVELGRLAGWSVQDLSDVYYLALLYHVGCTGAVDAQSRTGGGDDVNIRHWLSEADFANQPEVMRMSVPQLARQWGPADWARGMATFMTLANSSACSMTRQCGPTRHAFDFM